MKNTHTLTGNGENMHSLDTLRRLNAGTAIIRRDPVMNRETHTRPAPAKPVKAPKTRKAK